MAEQTPAADADISDAQSWLDEIDIDFSKVRDKVIAQLAGTNYRVIRRDAPLGASRLRASRRKRRRGRSRLAPP